MGNGLPPTLPPRPSLQLASYARARVEEVRDALGEQASFRVRVALAIVLAELEREVARAAREQDSACQDEPCGRGREG